MRHDGTGRHTRARHRSARRLRCRRRLLPAVAQLRISGTASCGRSCGCRGASTTRRRATSGTTNGCGCRSSRSTPTEREAVMTFVLGLTNEAPAERYIYKPTPRQKAIVEGRHVLDKYNCAGCHILDMERWDVAFAPELVRRRRRPTTDFPFLAARRYDREQIKASLTPDRRGLLHADCTACRRAMKRPASRGWSMRTACRSSRTTRSRQPFFEFHAVSSTRWWPAQLRRVGIENLQIPATTRRHGARRGHGLSRARAATWPSIFTRA